MQNKNIIKTAEDAAALSQNGGDEEHYVSPAKVAREIATEKNKGKDSTPVHEIENIKDKLNQ